MIVPVGAAPPASVAVSEIGSPIVTPAVAWVEIVGLAWETVECSSVSLQAPLTAALLASPE